LWELVEAGASDELAPSSNSHVRRRSLAGDIDAEMTELWTAAGHKFEPEKRLICGSSAALYPINIRISRFRY
jgi:hypothetical protein